MSFAFGSLDTSRSSCVKFSWPLSIEAGER
jgi:hypothetical protein